MGVVGDGGIFGLGRIKDVAVVGVVIIEVVVGEVLEGVDVEFSIGQSGGVPYRLQWRFRVGG